MVFAGVVVMLELATPVIHAQLLDATGQPEAQARRARADLIEPLLAVQNCESFDFVGWR